MHSCEELYTYKQNLISRKLLYYLQNKSKGLILIMNSCHLSCFFSTVWVEMKKYELTKLNINKLANKIKYLIFIHI